MIRRLRESNYGSKQHFDAVAKDIYDTIYLITENLEILKQSVEAKVEYATEDELNYDFLMELMNEREAVNDVARLLRSKGLFMEI